MIILLIIKIHFAISGLVAFVTALGLVQGEEINGVDNFWDWLNYAIFWELQLLKSTFKLFKNLFNIT